MRSILTTTAANSTHGGSQALNTRVVRSYLCSLEHPNDHYVGVSVVLNTMSARLKSKQSSHPTLYTA